MNSTFWVKFFTVILFIGTTLAVAQEAQNIIKNPQFDDGTKSWKLQKETGTTAAIAVSPDTLLSGPNSLQVSVTAGGAENWQVQVYQSLGLQRGRIYTLSFMARADTPHNIQVYYQKYTGDMTVFWSSPVLAVDTTPRMFGPFVFKSTQEDAANRLRFLVGGKDNVKVYLDSVYVTNVDDPDYFTEVEKFAKRQHTFGETTLPYRLCQPDFYNPENKYPLVLALHGAGERGTDNEIHIQVHRMATSWADSANQKNYPCFVVAPQCPADNKWVDCDWSIGHYSIAETPISNEVETVNDLLDSLIREFPIDTNKIYITGLSMGGYGTWDMISRYPHRFAAAIPMSGGGDSTFASQIKHIPVWAFHGEKDTTVPPAGSRDMVTALERAGRTAVFTHCQYGDCDGMSDDELNAAIAHGASLLYTEWKGKDHVMWAESFDLPQLFPWVFAQNKSVPLAISNSNEKTIETFALAQNYPNPFNPATTISYALEKAAQVKIDVINVLGQQVAILINSTQAAGNHEQIFNASGLESGVYYYRITINGKEQARKMLLLK
ncbi:MAG TPA: T9SS type A sorting domain-containing protein [bacterium]|nr:T9SS type A sorting domain-containing protein [bacterium]HPN45837.1 T9SS type A sorting domain-containing protein [bacterium]